MSAAHAPELAKPQPTEAAAYSKCAKKKEAKKEQKALEMTEAEAQTAEDAGRYLERRVEVDSTDTGPHEHRVA